MRSTSARRLRRPLLAVVAVLMAAVLAPPASASASSECPRGDSSPADLGPRAVRSATLCLLNAERRAAGLGAMRHNTRLARAARGHSRDMVAHGYFAHESRSGADLGARIAATGWMDGRDGWSIGENLAWGSGATATPRAIVAAWMESPSHRENVLQRKFHAIGIGVVDGVPLENGGTGATYTTDFGSKPA